MADRISSEKRSKNMAAIKSKNTKPEVFFRKSVFRRGYRYVLYSSKVAGHPDMYLPKYNTAVFVNGCFWHRHKGCRYAYIPKSNIEFWMKKFSANEERDQVVREELNREGIKCIVIWECSIKKMKKDNEYAEYVLDEFEKFLASDWEYLEI